MIKDIGGYFELADRSALSPFPVNGGVLLNTGRNALEYILRGLPDIECVHLPYYTCDAVLEPLERLSIKYKYYHIDERFEIAELIDINLGDYLIVNNYWGIKDSYINNLAMKYGDRLIVDNTQALFAPSISGVKAFYSMRKFVGVADGGVAVGGGDMSVSEVEDTESHNDHLSIRKSQGAEAGFKYFQKNETALANQPIRRMSESTYDILTHINYFEVIERRRRNFERLRLELSQINKLSLPDVGSFACPMIYPLWIADGPELRSQLLAKKIWVASYWQSVYSRVDRRSVEYEFCEGLIPIPIDQRYGETEMNRISKFIIDSI